MSLYILVGLLGRKRERRPANRATRSIKSPVKFDVDLVLARDGRLELPAAVSFLRIGLATIVMMSVLYLGLSVLPSLPAAASLALLVAAGGSAYLAAALALRAIPRQLLKP